MSTLKVGTFLNNNKYKIIRSIKSGGFGNTYEVEEINTHKRFAMKEYFRAAYCGRGADSKTVVINNPLFQDEYDACKKKFKKEAKRLKEIHNANVVKVYSMFEENNTCYYIMDLLKGKNLREYLEEGEKFSESQVIKILDQILHALKSIHDKGIYHMDIKPENIIMDIHGHCTLIDFGASKQSDVDGRTTTSSMVAFTPRYAPPEQLDGDKSKWGPWTDYYALAATMYNIITNKTPPSSSDILDYGKSAFQFPAGFKNEIKDFIVKSMQRRIELRPQNVKDINKILNPATSPSPTPKPTPSPAANPNPTPIPTPIPTPNPDSTQNSETSNIFGFFWEDNGCSFMIWIMLMIITAIIIFYFPSIVSSKYEGADNLYQVFVQAWDNGNVHEVIKNSIGAIICCNVISFFSYIILAYIVLLISKIKKWFE